MTEPHHHDGQEEGEDRLNRLYQMLAKSRATTHEIERRIAEEEEGIQPEELVRRRRQIMRRGLAVIPGIGAAAAFGRLIVRHHRDVVIAGASAAATVATVALVTSTLNGPQSAPRHHAPSRRPPAALPPIGHTDSPRTGPPKASPPSVSGTSPADVPSPSPEPARTPPGGGTSAPPGAPETPPGAPPSDPEAPITPQRCRLYFPRLGICLLPMPNSRGPA